MCYCRVKCQSKQFNETYPARIDQLIACSKSKISIELLLELEKKVLIFFKFRVSYRALLPIKGVNQIAACFYSVLTETFRSDLLELVEKVLLFLYSHTEIYLKNSLKLCFVAALKASFIILSKSNPDVILFKHSDCLTSEVD